MKRICLVISSLKGGGAERTASLMANHWARQGDQITLVTFATPDTDAYPLEDAVDRISLDMQRDARNAWDAVGANGKRIVSLRRAVKRCDPDVVLGFMGTVNILTLIACAGLRVPVLIMEQIDPREYPIGRIWEVLRGVAYPRAAALVVLSDRLVEWAEKFLPAARVSVIPNPVRSADDLAAASSSCSPPAFMRRPGRRTVIAMGRLTEQKGFDLLLRAFSLCAGANSGWDLVILGEGEDRPKLEALAEELGIAGRVCLPGRLPEPAGALAAADLFVMSSRFEGLPLALLEAMACRLPVISTDCPTGPREVIRAGTDGLLVEPENAEALAEAMSRLMSDDSERLQLAARAADVHDRFGLDKVMSSWDDLIDTVTRSKRNAPGRVKICFLIHQLETGGAERQLTTLLKGLDKTLFDITLITFKPGGRLADEIAQSDIRTLSLDKRRRWHHIATFLRFVRIVRKIRPQIVHSYMPTSNVFAGLLKPFVKRTRIIWGIRAARDEFDETDRLSGVIFRLQAWLARLADLVIANSEAGRQVCLRNGFSPERVIVIPNGIDIDRFKPDPAGRQRLRAEWDITEDQTAIGIVGRMDSIKDHPSFLQAAAIFSKKHPNARFVCIGDDGGEYALRLRNLAADLGIADKMVWAGMRSDMTAAYSALDINTSASLSEGFPNCVAEAMACGIPCVATDVGDCKPLIGATGRIVPARSADALANAWEECLAADYREMGRKARQRIVGEFAMSRLIERTEQVLWPKA